MTNDRIAQEIMQEIILRGLRAKEEKNHTGSSSIYIRVSRRKDYKRYVLIRISDHYNKRYWNACNLIHKDGEKIGYMEIVPVVMQAYERMKGR